MPKVESMGLNTMTHCSLSGLHVRYAIPRSDCFDNIMRTTVSALRPFVRLEFQFSPCLDPVVF